MAKGNKFEQISVAQLNSPTPITPYCVQYLPYKPSYCQFSVKNFRIFVAMATGVGLTQISVVQLNSPTPITPY